MTFTTYDTVETKSCDEVTTTLELRSKSLPHSDSVARIDEMLEALDKSMVAADANVQEWQEDFSVGDCFIQHTDMGFDIIAEIKETYPEGRLSNYYYCNAYSVACPNGELGDIHASVISARLPRKVFEAYLEEIQK